MKDFFARFGLGRKVKGKPSAASASAESDPPAPVPESLPVCRKPEDMPPADAVISGTGKEATVRLKAADDKHVVVLMHGKMVTILISVEIYQTKQAKRIFGDIREQIGTKFERERTMWATAEIVHGARARKKSAAASGETIATSQTRFAAEFASWLEYGMRERATDLHVQKRGDVAHLRFRIDGKLEPMANGREGQILGESAKEVIAHVYDKLIDKDSNNTSSFNERSYSSCTATYDLGDKKLLLRCQVNPVNDGFDFIARFRLETEKSAAPRYSLRNMGYTPSQISMIERAARGMRGLIIVAGIPNSAKTTLVEVVLNNLENREQLKVVTLDDPVEFKIQGASHATIKAVPGDPEESAKLYTQAVESWLRGNLDVLSAGEIRNWASGMTAVTAARVGCLGTATIHGNSFMGIFERLTDPEIGLSMRALTSDGIFALGIYQHLVPLLCQHCATTVDQAPLPVKNRVRRIGERFGVSTTNMRLKGGFVNGQPCPNCRGKGVHGQKVVAEMFDPIAHEDFLQSMRSGDDFGARAIWRSFSDGQFDTDNMDGKPVFLHALKDALDGKIDYRTCERFGNFDTFPVESFQHPTTTTWNKAA
ncbi:ATPase, T2SS/T4P/T4SS family [Agrobacterium tumefaciens]|uniref:ATPase, T2SS/T4P/T4SS family n=1 Tax=Agrobacterium tumefaciens TaxID=358 RepID=UPI0015716F68|nr:ATPase, T2SS/T4P/T4SS family [Agrobacterium tumefaciens]NTB05935.1 Flp pilus assembly complex ATPase component TadA [Agrobacterium tumefaciens]